MNSNSLVLALRTLRDLNEAENIIRPEPYLRALEQVSQEISFLIAQGTDDSLASLNEIGGTLSNFVFSLSLFAVDRNLVEVHSLLLLTTHLKTLEKSLVLVNQETNAQIKRSISLIEEKNLWNKNLSPEIFKVDIEV